MIPKDQLSTVTAFFLMLGIPLLVLAYRNYDALTTRGRMLFRWTLLCAVAVSGSAVLLLTLIGIRNPPEFDFLIFWLNGKIASQGLNYYSAQLATALAQQFHPSPEFRTELLNNPFLYPPTTILFFIPLGWFSFNHAALVWYAFQIACLVVSIPLIARVFLQDRSTKGTLLTSILMLALYGTYSNVRTGQTLFLLLLLVTLLFRDRDAFTGGIWLALCVMLKPFAAMFLVYAIVMRKWKALTGALVTLSTAVLLILTIFGPAVFKSYFLETNYGALPRSMYLESQNQSLLAWILRLAGDSRESLIVFALVAAILTGVTLIKSFRLKIGGDAIAFASALTLALLVYPGSLRSYSILLIVPIILLIRRNLLWPVALAYGLMTAGGGYLIGFASALLWLVFAIIRPTDTDEANSAGDRGRSTSAYITSLSRRFYIGGNARSAKSRAASGAGR